MDMARAPDPDGPLPELKHPAPEWFRWAISKPVTSHRIEVRGAHTHYLKWTAAQGPRKPGILFLHGGGAHANWWRGIAPYFAFDRNVVAMDHSGMGDSSHRPEYDAGLRVAEIRATIADSGLGEKPIVVGHSFGGYMTIVLGARFGHEIGAGVIVDSPVRPPRAEAEYKRRSYPTTVRVYPDYEAAVARFRVRPRQPVEHAFILEYIARHSLRAIRGGWTWKFDPEAVGPRRFREPFADHLANMTCPKAFIHGAASALVTPGIVDFMVDAMGPGTPVIEMPEAQHHLILDQPLAFVSTLRALLATWPANLV